jgi:hypothetical protein
MAWLRYDDRFTGAAAWDNVSYPARWHYLALIELCGSTGRYDGTVPATLARGCSDVPEPSTCLDELVVAGFLKAKENHFVVTTIAEHIPPPGERDEHLLPRKRANTAAYRLRRCQEGNHSKDCPKDVCPLKRASPPALPVTTGRDGTARDGTSTTELRLEEGAHDSDRNSEDPWAS